MGYYGFGNFGFRPYVPAAKRREQAAREVEKLRKKGRAVAPIVIEGRTIARKFWGKAWCDNLERYSDYENRLPRGRTYARNGAVIDLRIERGQVLALVNGSDIYKVKIDIATVAPSRWKAICADCAGSIGSLVELLQGKLSKYVMERVIRESDGLFPAASEIMMSCSCPDWADLCKHTAAALYGVGARLDAAPELLFTLRGVDRAGLIASAGASLPVPHGSAASERILGQDDAAALFGVEWVPAPAMPKPAKKKRILPSQRPPAAQGVNTPGVRVKQRASKGARRRTIAAQSNSPKTSPAPCASPASQTTPAGAKLPKIRAGAGKSVSPGKIARLTVAKRAGPAAQPEKRGQKASALSRRRAALEPKGQ